MVFGRVEVIRKGSLEDPRRLSKLEPIVESDARSGSEKQLVSVSIGGGK